MLSGVSHSLPFSTLLPLALASFLEELRLFPVGLRMAALGSRWTIHQPQAVQALYQKCHRRGDSQTAEVCFPWFWRLEVQGQVPSWPSEGPFPVSSQSRRTLFHDKGHSPIMGLHTQDRVTSQTPCLLITSHWA